MLTSTLILACGEHLIFPLPGLYSWPLSSLLGLIFIRAIWLAKIGMDRGLSPVLSFSAMFLANLVSMVIAVIITVVATGKVADPMVNPVIMVGFFACILGFVACISILPVNRLFILYNRKFNRQKINRIWLVLLVTLLFWGSIFFSDMSISQSRAFGLHDTVSFTVFFTHWITILAYTYCALAVSLFLTVLWEEIVVSSILKNSFLPEISRMNLYIMLGVWILLYALNWLMMQFCGSNR